MVIAHVITRLMRAGSEENTIGTCMAQAAAGHEVLLLHGNESDAGQVARCSASLRVIEVRNLVHAIDPMRDALAVRALRSLFAKERPTVVHTHQSKAGIIGRIAARLAQVPTIIHGVHIVPFESVGRLQRQVYLAAERAVAPYTDAYINVSEGTRQLYVKHGIGRPQRHFVAHSGFDIGKFQNASWPDDWRAICGIGEKEAKPPVALMLAAMEPRKRHVPFLEVFDILRRRVPNVRLLLAGEGPAKDSVGDAIARLGLQEHVRLLGFSTMPERLIALADLTVLTSAREGLPRVVVQSLSGGKPVVTTELPGLEGIIRNGSNGVITEANDLSGVASAVADLLLDRERLVQMQALARQSDVSSWGMAAMCNTISDIYRRVGPAGPVALVEAL